MNDPLRDDRVFPEEMHEALPDQKEGTDVKKNILIAVIILLLIVLSVFLYYRFGRPSVSDDILPEEQQLEILESITKDQVPYTPEHRDRTIEDMLRSSI